MQEYHCSDLPRLRRCPASKKKPAVNIQSDNSWAALGTAAHYAAAHLIEGASIADILDEQYLVDRDELASLIHMWVPLWERLYSYFPVRETEQDMSIEALDFRLVGRCDLICDMSTEIRLADWKFGHADRPADDQLRGYAWLALNKCVSANTVRACQVQVRQGTVEWWSWTKAELQKWWIDTLRILGQSQDVYNPSPDNCRYCARAYECPARATALSTAMTTMATGTLVHTADDMAAAVTKIRWLQSAAEQAMDLIRSEVEINGGSMLLSDGGVIRLTPQSVKKITDPGGAKDILNKHLSLDAIDRTITMSKTKVEKEISNATPKGLKTQKIRSVIKELQDAACISEFQQYRLEVIPRKVITTDAQTNANRDD
jgi:hypothetical protein